MATQTREKIKCEPFGGAAFDHEVLHARRRRLADDGPIAFEPGQERDDLVELGKAKTRQPSEADEKDDGPDVAAKYAEAKKHDNQNCAGSQAGERQDRHPAVQLYLAPLARTIEMHGYLARKVRLRKVPAACRTQDDCQVAAEADRRHAAKNGDRQAPRFPNKGRTRVLGPSSSGASMNMASRR